MWRLAAVLLLACEPKQPLQPSYFSAKRPDNAPLTCKEMLDCYARCQPLTDECMLLCDRRSITAEVDRARSVSYCAARNACTDRTCEEQHCTAELQACVAPPRPQAPSPMRPPPPMQPQPMQPQPMVPPPPPY